MTIPRFHDSDISRQASRVNRLERSLSDMERKLADLSRRVERVAYEAESQNRQRKDDLFLLVFALVNAFTIGMAVLSRR